MRLATRSERRTLVIVRLNGGIRYNCVMWEGWESGKESLRAAWCSLETWDSSFAEHRGRSDAADLIYAVCRFPRGAVVIQLHGSSEYQAPVAVLCAEASPSRREECLSLQSVEGKRCDVVCMQGGLRWPTGLWVHIARLLFPRWASDFSQITHSLPQEIWNNIFYKIKT